MAWQNTLWYPRAFRSFKMKIEMESEKQKWGHRMELRASIVGKDVLPKK